MTCPKTIPTLRKWAKTRGWNISYDLYRHISGHVLHWVGAKRHIFNECKHEQDTIGAVRLTRQAAITEVYNAIRRWEYE